MKQVIKVNGKVMGETNGRDYAHFLSQQRYKSKIVSNKKLYNRQKEKNNFKKTIDKYN